MSRECRNLMFSLCSAASHLRFNITDYVKHIKIFHGHDPSFKITCGIAGCQRTYNNFRTFVNHVLAMHNIVISLTTALTVIHPVRQMTMSLMVVTVVLVVVDHLIKTYVTMIRSHLGKWWRDQLQHFYLDWKKTLNSHKHQFKGLLMEYQPWIVNR